MVMKFPRRHLSPLLCIILSACGGVASTGGEGGDGDGDGDRPRRPGSAIGDGDIDPVPIEGDGDGVTCRPGEVFICMPPPECATAYMECLPDGSGWGRCVCDVISGVGGTPGVGGGPTTGGSAGGPTDTTDSDFVEAGRGTYGGWDGYLFTAAETGSSIRPEAFVGRNLCVSGTLGAAYEEWALVGWNIAQDIDPETFEGGPVNAISPGGTGVEVAVINYGGSGLRVQIQTDENATESWCASVPPAGGTIPWSDFRKECWTTGGEIYDGVTPISMVGVMTYAGSDTLPTAFDFCVLHLGPAL